MNPILPSLTSPASPAAPVGKSAFRIGLVGCGPRGLQCLASLASVAAVKGHRRLQVVVFEPAPYPGAGAVYDVRQPPYLRMNYATEHVDFWSVGGTAGPRSAPGASLITWLRVRYPDLAGAGRYVPRAIVGEYLHDCFRIVCRRLRSHAQLTVHRESVTSIDRRGPRWELSTAARTELFDEVVLAIGHEGIRAAHDPHPGDEPGAPEEFGEGERKQPMATFPVDTNLSLSRIAAGAAVEVRGFGLTALDAVLALTEGRGGKFQGLEFPDPNRVPKYCPSGFEPSSIHLWSRSGRPMLAKPTAKIEPIDQSFWFPYLERLSRVRCSRGGISFRDDVRVVVTDAAAALLRRGGVRQTTQSIERWFGGWSRYRMDAGSARQALLQSYAVATAARPIDIPYALGQTWRQLYPAIVRVIGDGGLQSDQWPSYQRFSREMERIAFGPPAETVGRLLALLRCRLVSTGIQPRGGGCDHRVNAVISAPQQWKPSGPIDQLVRSGQVHLDPVSGAIRVDRCGRPFRPTGGRVDGLAIFGRSTEGWVIGNDTLSRTLHPHIPRWADSILVSAR